MLSQLQAARRLGGLAAALPRAAELLLVAGGPAALRAAAVRKAPWAKGCGSSAATRALGAARGFCASAGSGDEPAEPPAAGAAPPERESAAARGDMAEAEAAPAVGAASAPARAKRAPNVGVLGEKTASGRPKPDERTVARLVELGWCGTAEAAEALLTKHKRTDRFPYETAAPAIDWLIGTLGEEEHSRGRSRAAAAVYKFSTILCFSTSALQRGWETVVHSREVGGLGLSEALARKRVAAYPSVLGFSKDFVRKRAAFLETLGVRDGCATITRDFQLLGLSEDRLHSGAEWLRSQGLDAARLVSIQPQVLMLSPRHISLKLDFMRSVVGLRTEDISSRFLTASLDSALRPRYFYARQRGVEQRYKFSSLIQQSDAVFLKRIHSLDEPATAAENAAYKAHIATPAFRAYMDEQEQAIRARSEAVKR